MFELIRMHIPENVCSSTTGGVAVVAVSQGSMAYSAAGVIVMNWSTMLCVLNFFYDCSTIGIGCIILNAVLTRSYSCLDDVGTKAMDHYVLVYAHVCFACFNACRHGAEFARRLVIHQTKRLVSHCSKTEVFQEALDLA